MDTMGEKNVLYLLLIVYGLGQCSVSMDSLSPELRCTKTDPCKSLAVFEWQLMGYEESTPRNCTVVYAPSEQFLAGQVKTYKTYINISVTGSFTLNGMNSGELYSVQIRCDKAMSEVVRAKFYVDNCGAAKDDDTVIEYKEPPSLLGGRDSMLGIVFGLFGLLIILVTTTVIWKRYRHRQRRERIRRYLGTSQIDPFENLQLRIDNQESGGSGVDRLIGSTDSMT